MLARLEVGCMALGFAWKDRTLVDCKQKGGFGGCMDSGFEGEEKALFSRLEEGLRGSDGS